MSALLFFSFEIINVVKDKIIHAMVEMIKVRLFFWFILILLKLHKPHNGVFKYRNVYLVINVLRCSIGLFTLSLFQKKEEHLI